MGGLLGPWRMCKGTGATVLLRGQLEMMNKPGPWVPGKLAVKMPDCGGVTFSCPWMCLMADVIVNK